MRAIGTAVAVTLILGAAASAPAQVAPEPSMVSAHLHGVNQAQAYFALPKNEFLLGGHLRFAVLDELDLGARAGISFVDGADDYVFVGGDGRYALIGQRFSAVGPTFNLSLHGGLGVRSQSGLTRWKIPLGFPTGLTFGLADGSIEVFTHPRLELGFQSGGADDSDLGLAVDVGAFWQTGAVLGILADIRFGNGIFDESDNAVFALGASARF